MKRKKSSREKNNINTQKELHSNFHRANNLFVLLGINGFHCDFLQTIDSYRIRKKQNKVSTNSVTMR